MLHTADWTIKAASCTEVPVWAQLEGVWESAVCWGALTIDWERSEASGDVAFVVQVLQHAVQLH